MLNKINKLENNLFTSNRRTADLNLVYDIELGKSKTSLLIMLVTHEDIIWKFTTENECLETLKEIKKTGVNLEHSYPFVPEDKIEYYNNLYN